MPEISTDDLLIDAIEYAHKAGNIQLGYFRSKHLHIDTKLNQSDIVTDADKASEDIVIESIHEKYPSHSILSEECGAKKRDSDYEWVIDPLDGTTNFTSGLPQFSVSIGIKYKGETIVGVVFAPYLHELFHAVKGEGAFLNGVPISVSDKTDLAQSVVCTGFPVDKGTNSDNNLDNVERVLPLVRGLRRLGSAAIDISYVAAGILDAFWELNLHEWDVCAGLLIAREAGATAWHFRDDRNVSILVGTPAIERAVAPLLSTTPRQ